MTNEWLEDEADAAIAMEQETTDAMEGSESWSPEAGDELRGLLLDVRVVPTKYGPKILMTVKDMGTKEVWDVWSSAALDRALYAQQPGLRRGIVLKYGGKEDTEYAAHKWYLASQPHDDASRAEAITLWTDTATRVAALNMAKDEKESAKSMTDKELEAPF